MADLQNALMQYMQYVRDADGRQNTVLNQLLNKRLGDRIDPSANASEFQGINPGMYGWHNQMSNRFPGMRGPSMPQDFAPNSSSPPDVPIYDQGGTEYDWERRAREIEMGRNQLSWPRQK